MSAFRLVAVGLLLAAVGCEVPTEPNACLLTGTVTNAVYYSGGGPAGFDVYGYDVLFAVTSDTTADIQTSINVPVFLESNGTLYPSSAAALTAGDRIQVWTDGGASAFGEVVLPGRHCFGLTRIVKLAPGAID